MQAKKHTKKYFEKAGVQIRGQKMQKYYTGLKTSVF